MNGKRPPKIEILSEVGVFFTIKSKSNGGHEFNTCFVAKGYSQIYGKNYWETTNMASIRLLLQIAVQYDLIIHHMDVKSAYLKDPLDYEICVEPSEGFKGKNGNYVCKLKKSFYGLKQSSQTWNKTFHTYLTKQNLVQSPVNPCMYIQNVCDQISVLLFWVDNILIASKPKAHLMQVKTRVNSRFKMTDLGKWSWFLGIQLECENNTIKMNQSRYTEKILSNFWMADCKPYPTPCEMDITKTSDEGDLIENTLS